MGYIMASIRRVRIQTFLKTGRSQVTLGKIFGMSQPWVSQIMRNHPEARLVEVDGEITAMEYSVPKIQLKVS